MAMRGENWRFWLPVLLLVLFTAYIAQKLVRAHVNPEVDSIDYTFTRDLPGVRGSIYDSFGESYPLVKSVPVWEYHLDPVALTNRVVRPKGEKTPRKPEAIVKTIAEALSLDYQKVLKMSRDYSRRYQFLAVSSDPDAHRTLCDSKLVSGVVIEDTQVRQYLHGRRLSHVLGSVNAASVGSAGIELKYNKMLTGVPGKIRGMRDARGQEIYDKRIETIAPIPGADVYLTVDHNLQYEAESALAAYPHPYDYFKGPLFRAEILESPENAWLILDWAHIIIDGTAGTAFFNAVAALYNGADASSVGTEQVDIFTYAENEKKGFESADYREAAAAAKARFGGRAMTVPEEQSKPEAEVEQRNCPYLEESAVVSRAGIDAWCKANGVHPNLFFMGVFARVLGLYANEKDVVFWTVNHGRKDPALRATQGLLVKTVPVLGELKGEATLVDYFKSFKLHKAGVYPFTHFCRDLGLKPGWGFVYQEGTTAYRIALGTSVTDGVLLAGGGAGELPVLQVFGGADRFRLQMTALPGRYDAAFLRGFAERCATVAENAVKVSCASLTSDEDVASPLIWLGVCAVIWIVYIAAVTKYSEGEEMDAAKKRRVGFLVGAIIYLQIIALLAFQSGIVVLVGVLLVMMRLMKRFLPEVSAS